MLTLIWVDQNTQRFFFLLTIFDIGLRLLGRYVGQHDIAVTLQLIVSLTIEKSRSISQPNSHLTSIPSKGMIGM